MTNIPDFFIRIPPPLPPRGLVLLFGTTFYRFLLYFITLGLSVANSSSPLEAEVAALSVASRSVDNDGNFVMDQSAIEVIETHARQKCGRLGKKFKNNRVNHLV